MSLLKEGQPSAVWSVEEWEWGAGEKRRKTAALQERPLQDLRSASLEGKKSETEERSQLWCHSE
jgi:hypothetical protein